MCKMQCWYQVFDLILRTVPTELYSSEQLYKHERYLLYLKKYLNFFTFNYDIIHELTCIVAYNIILIDII